MLIRHVAQLEPRERLLYWIQERHKIYLKRMAGEPRPWTDDEVLQSFFFTNPFRENDKTTAWFRNLVREPLRNDPRVLIATVAFRWFNYIPTGQTLLRAGLLHKWDEQYAVELLHNLQLEGKQVFTGAYMIKAGNGPKGCKVPNVCHAITNVWRQRHELTKVPADCRLQALWYELTKFPHMGPFMAYEVVCDLRWTYLLENARDVLVWSNPGPGAQRGLNRLLGKPLEAAVPREVWQEHTTALLREVRRLPLRDVPHKPEMRCVEHAACEWDKYERGLDILLRGKSDMRMKRKYNGKAEAHASL